MSEQLTMNDAWPLRLVDAGLSCDAGAVGAKMDPSILNATLNTCNLFRIKLCAIIVSTLLFKVSILRTSETSVSILISTCFKAT